MKNKPLIITLIVVLIIIVIGLINILIKGLTGSKFFNFGYTVSEDIFLNETYEDNFDSILVNSDSAEIEIKNNTSNNFKVIVYGSDNQVRLNNDSNSLNINVDVKPCIGLCFKEINKVEVYVPSDYNGSIKIKNKYGNIKIEEFTNADMDISNDCGDISVGSANNISINSSYGDVSLLKSNIANINQSCGEIFVDNVNSIEANNSYGDIKINKVNEYLDLSNSCGSIKVNDLNILKNSKIESNLGDIKIGSTNEIYIDAKVNLGDIKINNNYNKSDITLKIDNDCGDIKINN